MKFDDDFKEAIANLPSKEKDKLILRLLKKDLDLANRLYFELIDVRTAEDRRKDVDDFIHRYTDSFKSARFSPTVLMYDMREMSGRINEHVKITKDKLGEIWLNLEMLIQTLDKSKQLLEKHDFYSSYKFNIYIVNRAYKIVSQIVKLHDDLQYDFKEKLEQLGNAIGNNHELMRTCIQNEFDVNWLTQFELPEHIDEQIKRLRNMGFLR